jgi:hypothetical protein
VTQKVNSTQLKEIYFNPPSSVRSFHEPSKYNKMRKSNHSFLESKKHYQRYSEEEISQFEKFFNKHYYHPNTEADIAISNKQENIDFLDVFEPLVTDRYLAKDFDSNFEPNTKPFTSHDEAHTTLDDAVVPNIDSDQISQLEQDLLEQSTANVETFTEDFDLEESVSELLVDDGNGIVGIDQDENDVEHAVVEHTDEEILNINEVKVDDILDDDLIYLENLVSNGGNGIATASLDSIGNLLDEIVDNEKQQISNYETDVFNANIQSLFDTDPEADLPPVPQPPVMAQFITTPPIPPIVPTSSNNEDVDDEVIEPEIESSDDMKHGMPQFIATPPIPPIVPTSSNNEDIDDAVIETKIESSDLNDESVSKDLKVDAGVLNAKIEPFNDSKDLDDHNAEKETHDDFIDFIPDKQPKSKKSKLYLLDTILVILLLIVVGILLFHFRHLLPFDLPFMNRI